MELWWLHPRWFYTSALAPATMLALLSLSGCVTSQPKTPAVETQPQQPCWLESPVQKNLFGQVGIARNIHMGVYPPSKLSRLRAIADLCRANGEICDDKKLETALENQTLNNKALFFSDYEKQGYVYSLASYSAPSEDQCPALSCNITHCEPAWLCYPNIDQESAVLGISYLATSTYEKYNKAIDNALFQAEYLFGVNIAANKQLQQSRINGENFSILFESGDVNLGDKNVVPFHVAQQCQQGSSLYRHVVLDHEFHNPLKLAADDIQWMTNPKYKGIDGAIGSVDHPAGSGLVSDQIKLAIKRAAIELAYEKSSNVSDETIAVTYNEGGLIQITQINENTETQLKAQVLKIHFEQGLGPFLKVIVWIGLV